PAIVHGRAADHLHSDLRSLADGIIAAVLFNATLRGCEEVFMPVVLDADRISRSLTRIAHEILERNRGVDDLALVGIRTRGVPIAQRIAKIIGDVRRHEVPTGAL